MITVQHLTKRFGSHTAVDDLSFEVGAGEVLGFLGPNGAGKTTSMRMVTGYLPPSRGSVAIDGHDLLKRPIDAKRRIGYLPENPPLYPELTVRQVLGFVAEIKDVPRARRAAAVDRALQRANLGDVASKRIGTLSKGFKQRVGLAQAIVHEPPVLVLDEPTSSLDPKQRVEVRDLIAALRGEHTVLLSTHILPEVSQVTDRVVIINRGRVMAVDSPHNLSQRLRGREEMTVEVGGASVDEIRAAVAAVPGVARVQADESGIVTARIESALGVDIRADVARVLSARWRLLALRSESLTLEEIAVIGILVAAVTPSVVQRIMDGRVDETRVEAQSLYDGMIGKPGDGRFGFVGDLGRLPASFNELAQQGGLPAFATSTTRGVGMGWRGPYVNIGTTANDYLTDAFGRAYTGAASGQVRSAGPDGVSGNADDIVYPPAPTITGTVTATVKTITGGKTLVDPAGYRVDLFYANGGVEAALADTAAPFSFSNVPMGVHAVRVVRTVNPQAGTVVAQDTIVVRPSSTTAAELWF